VFAGQAVHSQTDVHIRPGPSTDTIEARWEIDITREAGPGSPLIFDANIIGRLRAPDARVFMRVYDAQDTLVNEAVVEKPLSGGDNRIRFRWEPATVDLGRYTIRFFARGEELMRIPWAEFYVKKVSRSQVAQELDILRADHETFTDHLDLIAQRHYNPPYAMMRAALVDRIMEQAETLFDSGDWQQAGERLEHGRDVIKKARAAISFRNDPAYLFRREPPDLSKLAIRYGNFQVAGRPVYLFGAVGWDQLRDDLELLPDLGLNLALFTTPIAADGTDSPMPPRALSGALAKAEANNVSVTIQAVPEGFDDLPAAARWMPTGIVTYPQADRTLQQAKNRERQFFELIRYLDSHPIVNSLSIAHRPQFQFEGETVRQLFIEYLQQQYPDREALNRSWKARYTAFDEVSLDDRHTRPAFDYDWVDFYLGLGRQYLSGMAESLARETRRIPLQIKQLGDIPINPDLDWLTDPEISPDVIAISGLADIPGGASEDYALDHPNGTLMYALKRSLFPQKPVFDLQLHVVPSEQPDADGYAYAHALLWDGVIHGLNAGAAWAWAHDFDMPSSQPPILSRPSYLEGFATAAIDINRLAEIVQAFQQAPSDLAILWSRSSRIYDGGEPYLDSMRRAFEGASFAGKKVRFLSESQIAAGALDGVRALIIPQTPAVSDEAFQAISDYVQAEKGAIIRTGTALPYNARGYPRQQVLPMNLRTILVRGIDTSTNYLSAVESAYNEDLLPLTPRAVNEFGYLVEGIKSRYVEVDGASYMFLLNIRHEARPCWITEEYSGGVDLISGQEVEFPIILPPLRPMLIELAADMTDVDVAVAEPVSNPE